MARRGTGSGAPTRDAATDRGPEGTAARGRAAPAAAPETTPVSDPRSDPGVIRVLVVDDHDLVRRAVVGLVAAQEDMEVVAEAVDGAAAIRAARRYRPDVVIMDVRMPGMGGAEATSAILASRPETAVVVLSTCDEAACGPEMTRAGARAYVEKSRPPSRLLESIRAVA